MRERERESVCVCVCVGVSECGLRVHFVHFEIVCRVCSRNFCRESRLEETAASE